MAEGSFKRKLAAVFSADVVGYSRLMGEDEAATVRVRETYKGVMSELIKQHRGRVVDAPGDNVLAEFPSVVDAVQCAVAAQNEFKARNMELPENRKMQFRIGINLGDVIEEGERIYGDGVNIAARVESLAEGGGICISGTAYDQVKNKIGLAYEYLGEQTLKNIAEPVRVYRVLSVPGTPGNRVVRADLKKMAFPLPDKPSIAVLPFTNMSDDPKQDYFSDGITEDLITDLSKVSGLFVIARNSTFVYKGKAVKIAQVAEELGVRYVMEGSVRKAGEKLRINAQVIDATTGGHLWSERYDGTTEDVFALQDKINQEIVAALAVKLTEAERALLAQKGTNNPAAYDEYLKGREHACRVTKEDVAEAEGCYKRALELDPKYGWALAALAGLYRLASAMGMHDALKISWTVARLLARQKLKEAMNEPTPLAYSLAGQMDLDMRKHDAALSRMEKALSLDSNDPDILYSISWALSMAGRPTEAMEHAKKGMRLDPQNPGRHLFGLGMAHFCLGNWEQAATVLEKGLNVKPDLPVFTGTLASTYAHLGRDKEAREAYETFRQFFGRADVPTISLAVVMQLFPFKERGIADSFAEGLIKSGLPGQLSDYIHVSKEDQLTGEEIRAMLSGATTTGFLPDGSEWRTERRKDGRAVYHHPTVGTDTGTWWMEGDTTCFQFQNWMLGMEFGYDLFWNPGGQPQNKDEYVGFGDFGMVTFSLVR